MVITAYEAERRNTIDQERLGPIIFLSEFTRETQNGIAATKGEKISRNALSALRARSQRRRLNELKPYRTGSRSCGAIVEQQHQRHWNRWRSPCSTLPSQLPCVQPLRLVSVPAKATMRTPSGTGQSGGCGERLFGESDPIPGPQSED